MEQSKILDKLGLTESDVTHSVKLFAEINPSILSRKCIVIGPSSKIETVLGYSTTRLRRAKALKIMGVTEDEIEIENAKNLGSLGNCGRKRSFLLVTHPCEGGVANLQHLSVRGVRSKSSHTSRKVLAQKSPRRKSSDVKTLKRFVDLMSASLRSQNSSTYMELLQLRERVQILENELSRRR